MGMVYRAYHLALAEDVAIKVLRRDVSLDEETVARFTREAQSAVRLKSEHVTVVVMAVIYFALHMMLYGSTTTFMLGQILVAVPLGMALGLQGAMVVEIFPLRTRVTSMSVAYSVTLALAGGTAPLVSTWLIAAFHEPLAPAFYILLFGAIGLAIMAPMQETNQRSLET